MSDEKTINKLEVISKIISLLVTMSIGFGGILVLIYCIKINFYPNNIQVGDGLFFIWTTLVFGFICSLIVFLFSLFGYTIYALLYSALNKIQKVAKWNKLPSPNPLKDDIILHIITAIFLVILLFSLIFSGTKTTWSILLSTDALVILTSLVFNGIFSALLIADKNPKPNKLACLFIVFGLYIVPFSTITGLFENSIKHSMQLLGIRNINTSIYIDNKYSEIVKKTLENISSTSHFLAPLDNNFSKIDNVDILFQGVGENTYIRFTETTNNKQANLTLPSNSVIVEKSKELKTIDDLSKEIIEKHEKKINKLGVNFNPEELTFRFDKSYGNFDIGECIPPKRLSSIVAELTSIIIETLIDNDKTIESIEIIGLASAEWKKSEDDIDAYYKNLELSANRAKEISKIIFTNKQLLQYGSWLNKKIIVKGISSINKDSRTVYIKIKPRVKNN